MADQHDGREVDIAAALTIHPQPLLFLIFSLPDVYAYRIDNPCS
jgi:hypothetical protein